MTSNTNLVVLQKESNVATVRLNDSSKLNPLSVELQRRLYEVLTELRTDRDLRAVILTGSGKAFCAGADLKALEPSASLGQQAHDTMLALTNPLILALRDMPMPVVAAVNGAAAGGGVGLALAADVVVMARSAYFYLPFLPRLGILPDLGATWFLERLVGRSRAVGMSLLDGRVSAEQAVAWGLAWACVEDAELPSSAMTYATQLARLPAQAAVEARAAFDNAQCNSLGGQLAYEAARQRYLLAGPDFAEGVQAFREKRNANFRRN